MSDSRSRRIIRGEANELGWVNLQVAPADKWLDLSVNCLSPAYRATLLFTA